MTLKNIYIYIRGLRIFAFGFFVYLSLLHAFLLPLRAIVGLVACGQKGHVG